jgi:hypothetical protein
MDIYEDIKKSMKQIVEETNIVLKYSVRAYKKIKEKTIVLNDIKVIPSEITKEWFLERNIQTITIPEFFDLVFKEASEQNRLNFDEKTITFCEKDAKVFGFIADSPVSIIDFFERQTNYFE